MYGSFLSTTFYHDMKSCEIVGRFWGFKVCDLSFFQTHTPWRLIISMVIIAYYDCSGLRVFDLLITIGGVIIIAGVTIVLLEIRFSQLFVVYFRCV